MRLLALGVAHHELGRTPQCSWTVETRLDYLIKIQHTISVNYKRTINEAAVYSILDSVFKQKSTGGVVQNEADA